MSGRFALVIGNNEYEDPILRGLRAPEYDVNDLAALLEDPQVGGFQVIRLLNRPSTEVRTAISNFLTDRRPDGTLLLYFSGHGIRSRAGTVYLAVRDTRSKTPAALGIDAHFLRGEMQQCYSRRQVLILDCCYSGAFARGKGLSETVDTKSEFVAGGYGVVVLTATSAVQVAIEAERVIGESKYSLFTHYLIEGLESGQADGAGGGVPDGVISDQELYDYAFQRVDKTKEQIPERLVEGKGPAIVIAKNRFFEDISPELQEVLRRAKSVVRADRVGAARSLGEILRDSNTQVSNHARRALLACLSDPAPDVQNAARDALNQYEQRVGGPASSSTSPGPPSPEALTASLLKVVVGQNTAVHAISDLYARYFTGMAEPGRTVGNFLLLGPTGSGKTHIVESTAEALFQSASALVRIDCTEFQHSHEIAKLIGSPPGYLGHRETQPMLTQETLDQCHTDQLKLSLILFDEIEKASDALWQLLLGILDKATFTLGDNRRVDLSKSMIFMTSNLGSAEVNDLMTGSMGFARHPAESDDILEKKIYRVATEAARRKFSPEFMNRIDNLIVFRQLRVPDLRKIIDIELGRLQQRVLSGISAQGFAFTTTEAAKEYLLEQGSDMRYGARYLRRAIQRLLVQPISNEIAKNRVRNGDHLHIDLDSATSQLTFDKQAENLSWQEMQSLAHPSASPTKE